MEENNSSIIIKFIRQYLNILYGEFLYCKDVYEPFMDIKIVAASDII
jgi:hypothetical protein